VLGTALIACVPRAHGSGRFTRPPRRAASWGLFRLVLAHHTTGPGVRQRVSLRSQFLGLGCIGAAPADRAFYVFIRRPRSCCASRWRPITNLHPDLLGRCGHHQESTATASPLGQMSEGSSCCFMAGFFVRLGVRRIADGGHGRLGVRYRPCLPWRRTSAVLSEHHHSRSAERRVLRLLFRHRSESTETRKSTPANSRPGRRDPFWCRSPMAVGMLIRRGRWRANGTKPVPGAARPSLKFSRGGPASGLAAGWVRRGRSGS